MDDRPAALRKSWALGTLHLQAIGSGQTRRSEGVLSIFVSSSLSSGAAPLVLNGCLFTLPALEVLT